MKWLMMDMTSSYQEFAQFKKQQEVEVIARFVVFTKMFMYAHASVPYQMYPLSILLQEAWTRDFTSFEVKAAEGENRATVRSSL
jgi:hypothetical protein